jgi:hypothetical protein
MNHTGANNVKTTNRPRKYQPHGLTSLRTKIHSVHSNGMYMKTLYLRAIIWSRELRRESPYMLLACSLVTSPFSSPQRTQTCAFGPFPWMNCSRLNNVGKSAWYSLSSLQSLPILQASASIERKFCSNVKPWREPTDSGWNCTLCIGNASCCRAITIRLPTSYAVSTRLVGPDVTTHREL